MGVGVGGNSGLGSDMSFETVPSALRDISLIQGCPVPGRRSTIPWRAEVAGYYLWTIQVSPAPFRK